MKLSLNKAAKHYKVSKSTLSEALNSGRLTASKDARGRWEIDPSEMDRVFPPNRSEQSTSHIPNTPQDTGPNTDSTFEIERLKVELQAANRLTETMRETVDDLRNRLDREGEERRQLTALLTDQRAKTGRGLFARLFA